jgi:hypothetical protein
MFYTFIFLSSTIYSSLESIFTFTPADTSARKMGRKGYFINLQQMPYFMWCGLKMRTIVRKIQAMKMKL